MADEAVAALEPRLDGYDQASSAAEHGRYVRHLFGLVVQCVHEGHAEPVIASSRQVAADRFDVALVGEQRIEALGQVHAILGAGKDALVQTYVALAGAHRRPAGQRVAAGPP